MFSVQEFKTRSNNRFNTLTIELVSIYLTRYLPALTKTPNVPASMAAKMIPHWSVYQYGRMADIVLKTAGITSYKDFGDAIFLLVDLGMLTKEADDSIQPFIDQDRDRKFSATVKELMAHYVNIHMSEKAKIIEKVNETNPYHRKI